MNIFSACQNILNKVVEGLYILFSDLVVLTANCTKFDAHKRFLRSAKIYSYTTEVNKAFLIFKLLGGDAKKTSK